MRAVVGMLRWEELDPARRGFDPSLARAAALEVVRDAVGGDFTRNQPTAGLERDAIERQLESVLYGRYGAWIAGWNWAASEPGGGGPICAWCCDDHSILRYEELDTDLSDAGALPTVDRVVAAVAEWHSFLDELAHTFAELRDATANLGVADRTEHAAARLVALVIERTGAEDAWYGTFVTLLRWFLESCGLETDEQALHAIVGGRFHSWVAPAPETVRTVTAALGGTVAAGGAAPATCDALATWFGARARAFTTEWPDAVRRAVPVDAHRAFIESHDRRRDPDRAARMHAALDACRASARRDEPLTFDRLAAWQALVLGEHAPVAWRTTDAFARHVRYAYAPDLPDRFDAALAEANGSDEVVVRAARAYLDVAFFHPFPDGNARAARLVLDHVLARAGLGLVAMEPVALLLRSATDDNGPFWLAYTLDRLIGPLA
jgi:hypothetical protein